MKQKIEKHRRDSSGERHKEFKMKGDKDKRDK